MTFPSFQYQQYRFINFVELREEQQRVVWQVRTSHQVRQYMFDQTAFPFESHMAFVERLRTDHTKAYFAIYNSDNHFLGSISLHPIDAAQRTADWGIYINPDYQAKGIGIQLANIFLEHIFSLNLLDTITAVVLSTNTRSRRFHERIGFVLQSCTDDNIYLIKYRPTMSHNALIVAEMSANHNGDKQIALETVRAAKRAGADAIKLQTYTPDTITLNCCQPDFQIQQGTLWDGQTLYQLYQQAYTPWEWHQDIFDEASRQGLLCFSTPFDNTAVDFLESLSNPIYKIASFEITDIPLIEYAASKMKPMVLSTGIAQIEDIQLAIDACRRMGNNDITLLKCTSSYPAPIAEANLCMIDDLAKRFGVKVGLSDHTIGAVAPIVAITQGATMIEKHFILDRNIGGPDAAFSMDENEFAEMVRMVRMAEQSIGHVDYTLTPKQLANRHFARSLYVAQDMRAGDIITTDNVRSVRPSLGLHPKYYHDIIGKRVNRDLQMGERMAMEYIEASDL